MIIVDPLKIISMESNCSLPKKTEHLQEPLIIEPKKSSFVSEQEE